MADTKVTGLTEDTAPASDSLVYTVDAPATTPVSRKTTLANFGKGIMGIGSLGYFSIATTPSGKEQMGMAYNEPTRVSTTNATVTTIDTIAISDNSLFKLTAYVIGRCSAGAGGNAGKGCHFEVKAAYYRAGAGPVVVGDAPITEGDTSVDGWDVNFTISSNNILVQVTGAATDSITWNCVVMVQRLTSAGD